MNLLDKNWLGLLIIAAIAFFSCEDSSDIGLNLDPDGIRLDVLYAELPLEATNVSIDSIRTSGDTRLLIGRDVDPVFGEINSSAICRLSYINAVTTGPASLMDDMDEDGKQIYFIDSAVMYMKIRKVHTSSFSAEQTLNVYQLADTIFPGPSYLSKFETPYLTDQLEAQFNLVLNEDSIRDFVAKDSLQYVVKTRMSDDFAERIFGYMRDDSESATSKIIYDYKGIAIVGDPANTALIGFSPSDSTGIRIHYHIRDHYVEDSQEKDSVYLDSLTLNLVMNGAGAYYNRVSLDRSGSLMSAAGDPYESFLADPDNIYLQPLSGIYPKVDMDTLVKFLAANPAIQINRMEFDMETTENSKYQGNVQDLRFVYVDEEDGSRINATSLSSQFFLFEAAILTDNGYLANIPEPQLATLDETSMKYSGFPTFFAQLVESDQIEVDHVILMPRDVTTPDFSIFDRETGFKIKLYYSLPE